MNEHRGKIIEERDDPTGKVTANIRMKRLDRHTTEINIVIVSADTGEKLFNANYSTDKGNGMSAHTTASNIIHAYCEAHDYIPDISTSGGLIPTITSVIRGSRW